MFTYLITLNINVFTHFSFEYILWFCAPVISVHDRARNLSVFSPNVGKYEPGKLRIRTLFMQCQVKEAKCLPSKCTRFLLRSKPVQQNCLHFLQIFKRQCDLKVKDWPERLITRKERTLFIIALNLIKHWFKDRSNWFQRTFRSCHYEPTIAVNIKLWNISIFWYRFDSPQVKWYMISMTKI